MSCFPRAPQTFAEAEELRAELAQCFQRMLTSQEWRERNFYLAQVRERLDLVFTIHAHFDEEVRRRQREPPPPFYITAEDYAHLVSIDVPTAIRFEVAKACGVGLDAIDVVEIGTAGLRAILVRSENPQALEARRAEIEAVANEHREMGCAFALTFAATGGEKEGG